MSEQNVAETELRTREPAPQPEHPELARYARRPEHIDQRLAALQSEWDIERVLEAHAAGVSLFGLVLGTTVNRSWFILSAVAAAMLLEHAVQGWSPPVALLRRLGFRTQAEIDRERYALKALRGDFKQTSAAGKRGTPDAIASRAFEATA